MTPRYHQNERGSLAWLSTIAFVDGAADVIAVGVGFHSGYRELLIHKLTA